MKNRHFFDERINNGNHAVYYNPNAYGLICNFYSEEFYERESHYFLRLKFHSNLYWMPDKKKYPVIEFYQK